MEIVIVILLIFLIVKDYIPRPKKVEPKVIEEDTIQKEKKEKLRKDFEELINYNMDNATRKGQSK